MSQFKSRSTAADQPKAAIKTPTLAKAASLHVEGKLREALDEVNRAIDGGDGSLEVFSAKAQLQFELEQFEDASKSYAKVLSLSPRHPVANFNLAVCLEKLGRTAEANGHYKLARSLRPGEQAYESRILDLD